uniref:ATP synthase F(1) complex subunit delta, mitochondrial n=1 Tax=Bubo bubo TaxID=30461 RepID=A0A8C0F2V7_BUBBB
AHADRLLRHPGLARPHPTVPTRFALPGQVFYNGANVKQVDVPTLTGSFGILASHVPTLQVLKPGVVTVYAEDGTATKYFASPSVGNESPRHVGRCYGRASRF